MRYSGFLGGSCLAFSLRDEQCPRFIHSSLFSWWGGYAIMEPMAKVECLGFIRMVPELIGQIHRKKPMANGFLLMSNGFLWVCRLSHPVEPTRAAQQLISSPRLRYLASWHEPPEGPKAPLSCLAGAVSYAYALPRGKPRDHFRQLVAWNTILCIIYYMIIIFILGTSRITMCCQNWLLFMIQASDFAGSYLSEVRWPGMHTFPLFPRGILR